jgi:hypothetical protein
MLNSKNSFALAVCAALAMAPGAHAEEITVFTQNFEVDLNWTQDTLTDGKTPYNGQTTGGESGERYSYTHTTGIQTGVKETIFTDQSTASVGSTPSNFSVTTRNWDIHDGTQNTNVSGYRTPNNATNTNMQGNIFGHVKSGSSLPDELEDNFYQISGLNLSSFESASLQFDFDAFIKNDGDAFGVGISTDGINFIPLLPASGMAYTTDLDTHSDGVHSDYYDGDLRSWIGSSGGNQIGFNGGGANTAGTAIFDLTPHLGNSVSIRFAFTTNNLNSGSGDGINIDNIKITGRCAEGTSGPGCEPPPPGGGVPEPASLSLALLGLTAAIKRRRARKTA